MTDAIAFVGLGVMGEPMCRNLAQKCGRPVRAFDTQAEPLQRCRPRRARLRLAGRRGRWRRVVFLSLPSGEVVHELVHAPLDCWRPHAGQIVVDLGTSPVETTRRLAP